MDHESIFDEAKKVALSERDSLSMRAQLLSYIREHPSRAPFSVRWSGTFSRLSGTRTAPGFRLAGAALMIVLVAGAGTSYAAQGALPGEILYPIKINVNEALQASLATTPQEKVALDASLANTRLDEAEELATQGKLTPENNVIVQQGLASVTEDFNTNLTSIASSTPASVAQIGDAQAGLDAALSAHASVLADIASSTPRADLQVKPILALVRMRAQVAHSASAAIATAITQSSTTTIEQALAVQQEAAQSQSDAVQTLASQDTASATTSAQINVGASTTREALQTGDRSLAQGKYREAFKAFQSAIQTAQATAVDASAAENLGASVSIPALDDDTSMTSTSSFDSADVVGN